MTPSPPATEKALGTSCGTTNVSPRAAKVSFALAILAIAGGTACIMTGHLPPAVILILAGVAGIMASSRTPFIKRGE